MGIELYFTDLGKQSAGWLKGPLAED